MNRQEKRAEIGVPEGAKLLISVGELSVRKNHRVVVEALQGLPDDYWYVIVGKGQLEEELKAMDTTGRLKLLGFRTDIVELLRSSDLFVFPSLQEGLPVALMEAMASGLTCVVSDIRGNTDLIDNTIGNVVPARKSISWVKAIETMDTKMLRIHGNTCAEIIRQFDTAAVMKRIRSLYKEI